MADASKLTAGLRVEHVKSGWTYEILGCAVDTATSNVVVVYKSVDIGSWYTRPRAEFLEKFRLA